MVIKFHGGSWAFGAVCAGAYFGDINPWWAVVASLLLLVPYGLRVETDNSEQTHK